MLTVITFTDQWKPLLQVHASPQRYHSAYIGACSLASMEQFQQICITAEEWKKDGVKTFKKWNMSGWNWGWNIYLWGNSQSLFLAFLITHSCWDKVSAHIKDGILFLVFQRLYFSLWSFCFLSWIIWYLYLQIKHVVVTVICFLIWCDVRVVHSAYSFYYWILKIPKMCLVL